MIPALRTRRSPTAKRRVALAATLLVALAACGDDDVTTPSTSETTTSTTTTPSTTEPVGEEVVVRAYFLRDEKVGPVGRPGNETTSLEDALEGLLEGPTETETQAGFSTTIPEGTTLNGVQITGETVEVDLSAEFESGGGSLSMLGRVAQVVFTATQFGAEDVTFAIDGEPLTVLGGEGVMLDEPQSRLDQEDFAPAILVESPLPFEEVTSPLRITGTANTFEAVFQINVVDGEGLIVYDEFAMATSGTGTRGTFDETVEFEVPRAGIGAVIVFEYSAQDGRQINIVEVPLKIS